MAARAAIPITQLDNTFTGMEARRATSHAAGKNIDTHGSAFSKSSRDPDTETTAPAQTPTLPDNATAAHGGSPRTRCTLAAVTITLTQQPANTAPASSGGAGTTVNTVKLTKSASTDRKSV